MITIKRVALLRACETVKPALATKDFIEELMFLWFDGETVTAYNDAAFGIQAPLKSGLRGGFRGSILLGFLANTTAEEIEVELEESDDKVIAVVRAGRAQLRMVMYDESRAVHKLPEEVSKSVKLPASFCAALKMAVISVAPTSAVPDQAGVTLAHQKGALDVYTSDAKTISWATVPDVKRWPEKKRVLLPIQFAEELIRLGDEEIELHISSDEVMAVAASGVRLFTRLIEVSQPLDFATAIEGALDGVQLLTIPPRLRLMLERSIVMLDGQQEQSIGVAIDERKLNFHADTFFGELKDSLSLKNKFPEAMRLRVNPALIKRAFLFCSHIGFASDRVVMRGDDFVHLIGSYESGADEATE